MTYKPRTETRSKAFTLVELIVVVVVLGILASIAIVGYKTVVDKSLEAKQKMRMTQILKEAKILYTQRVYTDTAYPWDQAVADAVDDLPTYSLNAWSEGVSATGGGSNLNAATNGWTVQTDTGSGVYSVAPNDIVTSTSGAGIVYVASAISATQGVFGMISATTAPVVWTAACSGSSCDASSATSGPPAGGAYAPGTTAPSISVSYAASAFSLAGSSQVLSATTTGSPTSFSYTGTLPAGVSFSTSTGAFTGPSSFSAPVTQFAVGLTHTCAVMSGAAKCWGDNTYGQLGDGTTTQRTSPTQVSTLSSGVVQIAAGNNFTCARTSTGAAYCWGQGTTGQLGNATWVNSSVPTMVIGYASGVSSIAAGGNTACAILSSGALWCWGNGGAGAVGDGAGLHRNTPSQVTGLTSGVASVDIGGWDNTNYSHACAVLTSGSLRCWGKNGSSQVGDGTTTDRMSPVQVSGLTSGVTAVALTAYSSCALASGGVKCWGWGGNGQMGDGLVQSYSVPTTVISSGVTALGNGQNHFCAVVSGATWCWGQSSGSMGDSGPTNTALSRLQVVGLTASADAVVSVNGGLWHTCVLRSSGALQCWGVNTDGRLGDATTTSKYVPTGVSTMSGNPGFPASITVTATNSGGSSNASVTLSTS